MTDYTAEMVLRAYALMASVEAMKAENAARERRGEAQAWPGSCFEELAKEIDGYADCIHEARQC